MRTVNGYQLPRILTAAQAGRLGLTRARTRTELRRGNWQRLASGVLLTRPDEPTRADWAEVGVALAGPGAAVTGWDALRAAGFGERTAPPPSPPVVLARAGMNRVVGGVRLRRTSRPYTARTVPAAADLLPLTPVVSPARAVADAALEYRDRAAVRALVTSAIQRRACRLDELLAELAGVPRNRSAGLRSALADAADGARSVAEARAARCLARAPVPGFELNVPIVRGGRVLYVVDVLWRALRAALEIDSREYHFAEADWKATMARHNTLTGLGLAVTHYPPSAVARPGWAEQVRAWLAGRAAELGVPMPRTRGVLAGGAPAPFAVDGR